MFRNGLFFDRITHSGNGDLVCPSPGAVRFTWIVCLQLVDRSITSRRMVKSSSLQYAKRRNASRCAIFDKRRIRNDTHCHCTVRASVTCRPRSSALRITVVTTACGAPVIIDLFQNLTRLNYQNMACGKRRWPCAFCATGTVNLGIFKNR